MDSARLGTTDDIGVFISAFPDGSIPGNFEGMGIAVCPKGGRERERIARRERILKLFVKPAFSVVIRFPLQPTSPTIACDEFHE
jgi:hypothetical protein